MKIVNRRKFFRMVILTVFIITFVILIFSNNSYSKGEVKEKVLYISEGDTLWNIATYEKENNAYYEQKDIRDIVYEIKKINNIDNSNSIQVGQKIVLNSL